MANYLKCALKALMSDIIGSLLPTGSTLRFARYTDGWNWERVKNVRGTSPQTTGSTPYSAPTSVLTGRGMQID
jgi:hypothetical protein